MAPPHNVSRVAAITTGANFTIARAYSGALYAFGRDATGVVFSKWART